MQVEDLRVGLQVVVCVWGGGGKCMGAHAHVLDVHVHVVPQKKKCRKSLRSVVRGYCKKNRRKIRQISFE